MQGGPVHPPLRPAARSAALRRCSPPAGRLVRPLAYVDGAVGHLPAVHLHFRVYYEAVGPVQVLREGGGGGAGRAGGSGAAARGQAASCKHGTIPIPAPSPCLRCRALHRGP